MASEGATGRAVAVGPVEGPVWAGRERRIRIAAGLLALVTASVPFLARLGLNGRVGGAPVLAGWMHELATLAIVGPAVAAGVLAVTTDDDLERVGLAFVAAFGLLAAVVPTATVPAVGALVGGGGLALARRIDRYRLEDPRWRLAPAALLTAGIAASILAAMGVLSGTLRPTGSHLVMLGAAATPALLGHGRGDWALGGAVAGLLVAAGISAPFLTGAVALVGGGVVATSLLVMAAGLCGIVTTASAALRTRHWIALSGAGLLLVAGVPATLPRAMAAMVGILLLVEPRTAVVDR